MILLGNNRWIIGLRILELLYQILVSILFNYPFFLILFVYILWLNMIKSFGLKSFLAIIICILYATSDELHQLFVMGRSCELRDVFIDSLGSVSGIIIYNLIEKNKKNIRN